MTPPPLVYVLSSEDGRPCSMLYICNDVKQVELTLMHILYLLIYWSRLIIHIESYCGVGS